MTEDEIEGLAYDSLDDYCKEYNKDCEKCPCQIYSTTYDCYGCNCGLYLKAFVDGFKKSKEILLNTISNILRNE